MTIRLLASDWLASRFRLTGDRELELPEGASAADAAQAAGLPEAEIGIHVVNGAKAAPETLLKEGDTIKFLPWIIGG